MNILIFHTELRGELFDGDTFVAGRPQSREDAGFQRAASAAGPLRSGNPADSSRRGKRATATPASSSPTGRGLGLSPRIGTRNGSFNSPEFLDDHVTLPRELDKCLKS